MSLLSTDLRYIRENVNRFGKKDVSKNASIIDFLRSGA